MINVPAVKVGIVAVSRDCFPESLSVKPQKGPGGRVCEEV